MKLINDMLGASLYPLLNKKMRRSLDGVLYWNLKWHLDKDTYINITRLLRGDV